MVRLRALEPSDVDRLYIWENTPEMWRYGFSPAPLSRHQLWEYVTQYDANPLAQRQLRLMIDAGEETVGTLDLYDLDARNGHTFIGIMIAPQYRRHGYASEAIAIAATVADDNHASSALFEKCGFRHTATLPQWVARSKNTYTDARIFTLPL